MQATRVKGGITEADAALLEELRAGSAAAYEQLVRSHGPRLLQVARRLLRSEADAQDALQESFLSAFRALDRFQAGCRISTWLHRIVVNACLMRLRTRRNRPEEALDELLPQFGEDGHHRRHPPQWLASADVLVERREVRTLVRASIDRLPENYRTVLLLRDIEELDTAETADLLGIEPGAVKVRLHRARQALRALLEPHLERGAL